MGVRFPHTAFFFILFLNYLVLISIDNQFNRNVLYKFIGKRNSNQFDLVPKPATRLSINSSSPGVDVLAAKPKELVENKCAIRNEPNSSNKAPNKGPVVKPVDSKKKVHILSQVILPESKTIKLDALSKIGSRLSDHSILFKSKTPLPTVVGPTKNSQSDGKASKIETSSKITPISPVPSNSHSIKDKTVGSPPLARNTPIKFKKQGNQHLHVSNDSKKIDTAVDRDLGNLDNSNDGECDFTGFILSPNASTKGQNTISILDKVIDTKKLASSTEKVQSTGPTTSTSSRASSSIATSTRSQLPTSNKQTKDIAGKPSCKPNSSSTPKAKTQVIPESVPKTQSIAKNEETDSDSTSDSSSSDSDEETIDDLVEEAGRILGDGTELINTNEDSDHVDKDQLISDFLDSTKNAFNFEHDSSSSDEHSDHEEVTSEHGLEPRSSDESVEPTHGTDDNVGALLEIDDIVPDKSDVNVVGILATESAPDHPKPAIPPTQEKSSFKQPLKKKGNSNDDNKRAEKVNTASSLSSKAAEAKTPDTKGKQAKLTHYFTASPLVVNEPVSIKSNKCNENAERITKSPRKTAHVVVHEPEEPPTKRRRSVLNYNDLVSGNKSSHKANVSGMKSPTVAARRVSATKMPTDIVEDTDVGLSGLVHENVQTEKITPKRGRGRPKGTSKPTFTEERIIEVLNKVEVESDKPQTSNESEIVPSCSSDHQSSEQLDQSNAVEVKKPGKRGRKPKIKVEGKAHSFLFNLPLFQNNFFL